jgi:hypothetical protein
MELEVKREPVFLPGIWRKLIYTLIMVFLVPFLTVAMTLLLIWIGINPAAWRSAAHRTRGSRG